MVAGLELLDGLGVPADVFVFTPEEVERFARWPGHVVRIALQRAVVGLLRLDQPSRPEVLVADLRPAGRGPAAGHRQHQQRRGDPQRRAPHCADRVV